jgi:hypothetical protein
MTTPGSVLVALASDPASLLIRRWNWKSALYSSLLRAALFLVVNLTSGWSSALSAMLTEFLYRAVTAGFYGAVTQAFRKVEPPWKGTLAAVTVLMLGSHSLELLIHWWRGTPNLAASIAVSACFTLVSTLFNLHAMRRGVFVTDQEAAPLIEDIRRLPGVLSSFAASAPRLLRG